MMTYLILNREVIYLIIRSLLLDGEWDGFPVARENVQDKWWVVTYEGRYRRSS